MHRNHKDMAAESLTDPTFSAEGPSLWESPALAQGTLRVQSSGPCSETRAGNLRTLSLPSVKGGGAPCGAADSQAGSGVFSVHGVPGVSDPCPGSVLGGTAICQKLKAME